MRNKKDNQWVKDILGDPDIISVIAALSFVNLKGNEIDVLKHRFLDGRTQNETAEILDIDPRTVQRREYEALRKCEIVWKNNSFAKFILQKQKEKLP